MIRSIKYKLHELCIAMKPKTNLFFTYFFIRFMSEKSEKVIFDILSVCRRHPYSLTYLLT